MKFENKGKWIKEAEDKLAAYDTQEHPDYLDGDNKVCTFEDDEITNFEEDDLDIVEEDDALDSPEEEEDAIAMSESSQKNEKAYKVNGKILKIGDKVHYNLYGTDYTGTIVNFKDHYKDNPVVVAHKNNAKDLQLLHPSEIIKVESSQKNEAFGPDDIVSIAKQMDFKKQYLQGKDKRKVNANSFYFDNIYVVDDNTGSNIPGAKLGMKYKDLAAALDKFFGESAQKNEDNTSELK